MTGRAGGEAPRGAVGGAGGGARGALFLAGGGLAGGAAALLLAAWLSGRWAEPVETRVPSPPRPGELAASLPPVVDLSGGFASLGPLPPRTAGAWPRFRGETLDGVSRDAAPLDGRWPPGGPPVLWSLELGEGHGGAAVRDGRVYLLDYDEKEKSDVLRCLSLADGREAWRRWYRTDAVRNHGVSRTVPALDGPYVVTLGPRCHVLCVDAATGAFRWGIDLVREWGSAEPLWYTAQSPLVEGGLAILAPAGRALLAAVSCRTGKVAWETPNPRGWRMSHASVVPMTVAGRRMYVYAAEGGIAGVAADGKDAGSVLFETEEWNPSVQAPTPVPLPGGRLLVTAGYGAGSALFRVEPEGERFRARLERRIDRQELACEQQTPVFHEGLLFAVLPKDGGGHREQLVCADLDGRVRWRSGKERRFGLGPFLVADGKVIVLGEDGTLVMAKAAGDAFVPLAEAKVLPGPDAWAPMALADGKLLARDTRRLVCLDLASGSRGGDGPRGGGT